MLRPSHTFRNVMQSARGVHSRCKRQQGGGVSIEFKENPKSRTNAYRAVIVTAVTVGLGTRRGTRMCARASSVTCSVRPQGLARTRAIAYS